MESTLSGIDPGILIVPVVVGLAALWISALVSISRRSRAMSGLELIGWCALVIFAQFFGPLIWFFAGRDRYAAPLA
jgi:hypothetical protein